MRAACCVLLLVSSAWADVSTHGRSDELVYMPDEDRITRFAVGTRLFVAHDTTLHAAPRGAVMRKLSFGREVQVLRGGSDRWYEVRLADEPYIAWVFGGALTPFGVRGDLDGDGRADDLVTVYFDEDGYLHMRSRVGGQVANGVLHVADPDDFARGGRIFAAKLLPRDVAGIPLLAIDADTGRCCKSFVKYLSFAPHDIRHALTVNTYFQTSEQAITRTVRFDAVARTLVVSDDNQHAVRYRLDGRVYRLE